MLIVTLTDTYFAKYIIENKARCDNNIMITKKKTKKKTEICWSCFKKNNFILYRDAIELQKKL